MKNDKDTMTETFLEPTFHIIYVDDNEDDAYIVKKCLSKLPFPIICNWISDGATFLSYLRKEAPFNLRDSTKAQHLILLDINMPGLDGFQVLAEIKQDLNKEFSKLPIVMFSSSNQQQDKDKSLKLGANDYLVKPETYTDMLDTLKNLITTWKAPSKTPTITI